MKEKLARRTLSKMRFSGGVFSQKSLLITEKEGREIKEDGHATIISRLITFASGNFVILIAAFTAALSLSLRLVTAARLVTFADSGDFLAAIETLGNCHGPGYPLYLMTCKLFTLLFPFGTIAFRASVYSALFASAAALIIFLVILKLSGSALAGFVGSLAFSFSYTFWYQSVIPETYSLNAFFIALMILITLKWEELVEANRDKGAENFIFALSFTAGLSLANHPISAFALAAIFLYMAVTKRRALFSRRVITMAPFFFALGLLSYLYLPASAFRGPAYNFGDPATPANWIRHITMHYQRGGLFKYPIVLLLPRLLRYMKTLLTEFPYYWWLGFAGLTLSFFKVKRKHSSLLLTLFLLLLLPAVLYRQHEAVLRAHFYYPSYMVFSVWVGIGALHAVEMPARAIDKISRIAGKIALPCLVMVILITPLVSIALHVNKVDKSNYTYAHKIAGEILESAEEGAVVLIDDDNVYFPARYRQLSEKKRPDLRLILPAAISAPGFEGKDLLKRATPFEAGPGKKPRFQRVVEKNYREVPTYTTFPGVIDDAWSYRWEKYALKVVPRGTVSCDEKVELREALREFPLPEKDLSDIDSDAREALAFPLMLLGTRYVNEHRYREAAFVISKITRFFTRDQYVFSLYSCFIFEMVYELYATALNHLGKYRETLALIREVRSFSPDFASLQFAFALRMTKDLEGALSEVERVMQSSPGYLPAVKERGYINFYLGKFKESSRDFGECVKSDPSDNEARFSLAVSLLNMGKTSEGKRQLQEIIKRAPSTDWSEKANELLRLSPVLKSDRSSGEDNPGRR